MDNKKVMRNENTTLRKFWEKHCKETKENILCEDYFGNFENFVKFMNTDINDIYEEYEPYLNLTTIVNLVNSVIDNNKKEKLEFYIIRTGTEDIDYEILVIVKDKCKKIEIPYYGYDRKLGDIFKELIALINNEV